MPRKTTLLSGYYLIYVYLTSRRPAEHPKPIIFWAWKPRALQLEVVKRRQSVVKLVPRAFSSFKMAVEESCWNTPRIMEYFVTWHTMKWLFRRLFPASGGRVCFLQSETVVQTKQRHFIVFTWQNSDESLEPFLAALARGFSDRHFERGEGPGDKVDWSSQLQLLIRVFFNSCYISAFQMRTWSWTAPCFTGLSTFRRSLN